MNARTSRWLRPALAAQIAALVLIVAENLIFHIFDPVSPPPLASALGAAIPALGCSIATGIVLGAAAWMADTPSRLRTIMGTAALFVLIGGGVRGIGLLLGVDHFMSTLTLTVLLTALAAKVIVDFVSRASSLLAALVPSTVVTMAAVLATDNIYALQLSSRRPLDPNALLFTAMTGLALFASVCLALAATSDKSPFRRHLVASLAVAGCAATLYLNRVVVAPRLYLEAHVGIAFMEFLLLSTAFHVLLQRWLHKLKPVAIGVLGATLAATIAACVPSPWAVPRTGYHPELFYVPFGFAVDRDDDGFEASWAGGRDCNDSAHDVHPLRPEIMADNIDQNCDGNDEPQSKTQNFPPSSNQADLVILISIDTLRPNNMSVYDGPLKTTPNLDQIRGQTTRFTEAYAAGGITTLSLPSILRGRIPLAIDFEPVYRTTDIRYVFPGAIKKTDVVNRIFPSPRSDRNPTIASVFSDAGRQTLAFVDDGPAKVFQKGFGFEQGFQQFHFPNPPEGPVGWNRTELTSEFLTKLSGIPKGAFVWFHYYDPHNAVAPCRRFQKLPRVGCYDDAIHDVDEEIGRLITALKSAGRWRQSMLAITSDHGEGLGEHGLFHHGLDSFREFVHVPLLVKFPNQESSKDVVEPVSLVDLAPTLIASAGLNIPKTVQGINLANLGTFNRPIISQMLLTRVSGTPYRQNSLLVKTNAHIMFDRVSGRSWVYDTKTSLFSDATHEQIVEVLNATSALEARRGPNQRRFP